MREKSLIRLLRLSHQMGMEGVPFSDVLDLIRTAEEIELQARETDPMPSSE